jgi:hypothetical protein
MGRELCRTTAVRGEHPEFQWTIARDSNKRDFAPIQLHNTIT